MQHRRKNIILYLSWQGGSRYFIIVVIKEESGAECTPKIKGLSLPSYASGFILVQIQVALLLVKSRAEPRICDGIRLKVKNLAAQRWIFCGIETGVTLGFKIPLL